LKVSFGVHLPNGGEARLPFDALREVAVEAERHGFRSIWVSDHLVYPEDLATPPGPPSIYEPLTTLSALSQATKTVTLGTSVLLPLRHPVAVANMLATLDHASNGRLQVGMGVGWYEREFNACSIPFRRRWLAEEETITALKALWTQERASFGGRLFAFKDVWVNPKPLQRPHPPILLGGAAPRTFERVARLADGWMPWCPTVEAVEKGVAEVKRHLRERGRGVGGVRFYADFMASIRRTRAKAEEGVKSQVPSLGETLSEAESRMIAGDPETCVKRIKRYAELGVSHIILGFAPLGEELEQIGILAEEVMPHFTS